MVVVVSVQGVDKVLDLFGNLRGEIPLAADRDSYNVAEMYGKALRDAMYFAGIQPFTWELYNSTKKVTKIGDKAYQIAIPIYGEWLDSMKPHVVKVEGKPELERWARTKGISAPYLHVKPHPFIELGIDMANQRLSGELENGEVVKTIRRGGK